MAVSSSSIRGFTFRKSLIGTEHPGDEQFLIANSTTMTIGDAVRLNTSGYLVRSAAGEPVLGVCIGLVDQNGIPVFSPRAQGTAGATITPDDTVATSSTNVSDGTRNLKALVILDPSGASLFYNLASGALAQTNLGQFFDVGSNSGQIDQSSASDSNGQFQLLKLDPDGDGNTSKGLFRVNESQFNGGLDSATAKITA